MTEECFLVFFILMVFYFCDLTSQQFTLITHEQQNNTDTIKWFVTNLFNWLISLLIWIWILTVGRPICITFIEINCNVSNANFVLNFFMSYHQTSTVSILATSLFSWVDGEDEGGCLVGFEGGWHNQVFTRLQHKELYHLTGIHVFITPSNRQMGVEEHCWKLPTLRFVLKLFKVIFQLPNFIWRSFWSAYRHVNLKVLCISAYRYTEP